MNEHQWESPVAKAARNPQSLRLAINAMCAQCMGECPGWRNEVRHCTAPHCALWNVRPYQSGEPDL